MGYDICPSSGGECPQTRLCEKAGECARQAARESKRDTHGKTSSSPARAPVDDGRVLTYFCDEERHLVCLPYSTENLHLMAQRMGIGRHWFHRTRGGRHAHYDIPVKMIEQVRQKCILLTPRDIVRLCREAS